MFGLFTKKPKQPAYLKIDENGQFDLVGEFNPELLADILFIMKQETFYPNAVDFLVKKHGQCDFTRRLMTRVLENNKEKMEKAVIHPLDSWKGISE